MNGKRWNNTPIDLPPTTTNPLSSRLQLCTIWSATDSLFHIPSNKSTSKMGCARSQYDLESEARGVAVNKMRVPNVQCGMVSHTNDGLVQSAYDWEFYIGVNRRQKKSSDRSPLFHHFLCQKINLYQMTNLIQPLRTDEDCCCVNDQQPYQPAVMSPSVQNYHSGTATPGLQAYTNTTTPGLISETPKIKVAV